MTQSLVTVVVPFPRGRSEAVQEALHAYGCLGSALNTSFVQRLRARGFVHFMSGLIVEAGDGEESAHLIIEVSADGDAAQVCDGLTSSIPDVLLAILAATGERDLTTRQLSWYLQEHDLRVTPGGSRVGLEFCGTPDMSVGRILGEAALSRRIRDLVLANHEGSAMSRLEALRSVILRDPHMKWALVCEPIDRVYGPAKPVGLLTTVWSYATTFLWPIVVPPLFVILCSLYYESTLSEAGWRGFVAFTFTGIGMGIAYLVGYRALLKQEEADAPFDVEPPEAHLKRLQKIEDLDGVVQNHLAAVSIMKRGWWRRAAVRIALWLIGEHGVKSSQPGFIDKIGSIHFARWVKLPWTNRLVFLSNYDGSWESYLEDFIARLRDGLSSVWSNTVDFPKTTNLVQGGAGDGTRFKRWARRQQVATPLWFSAYPNLSTHRIRTNAAIRHGFAAATTEAEAAKWLGLLGFAGRDSLELLQIPTLAFGGLSRLPYGHCLVIQLPDDEARARAWLRAIAPVLTYGDRSAKSSALVAGFTCTGLAKLGLGPESIATFPMAFKQGMFERAHTLGDSQPGWKWCPFSTDAVMLLYDTRPAGLDAQVDERRKELESLGCVVTQSIPMAWLAPDVREAFGFRDGISQPAMRGTVRESGKESSPHAVNPGELVLGYRDNLGFVPPCPQANGRDIGRNGAYLVIRQLEQDPKAFQGYIEWAAQHYEGDARVPKASRRVLAEWFAAKMVGRWRDGTSLVRHPHEPGTRMNPGMEPDNEFMFGREDPDGLRCPFGAHVRRANPRDSFEPASQLQLDISNRHRILRVGRNYDPLPGGKNPGLLFMCINADIERQFEFLQQSWILGPEFHGLQDEIDPVISCNTTTMVVPTPEGPLELRNLRQFVTMLGGGYFFLPGKSAVALLTGD